MVKFAERLEDAKQSEWAAYYVDYDRLKLLLRLIVRAAERPNANAPCGASNFDIDGGFGLLEPTPVLAPHLAHALHRARLLNRKDSQLGKLMKLHHWGAGSMRLDSPEE